MAEKQDKKSKKDKKENDVIVKNTIELNPKLEEEKKSKKDKKENDVIVKNTIDLNPKLEEEAGSTAVFTFGRMNPPTIGHEKLVKKIEDVAKRNSAMPHIYLSQSYDSKKNPLPYKTKISLAKRAFGKLVTQSAARTVIEVVKELQDMGHKKLIMVVGSDRVNEFKTLLNRYNGKDFEFDSIEVVSAGERDPDADGAEGMSASKMREAVSSGNEKDFEMGLPSKLKRNARTIFNAVKTGMKIAEEMEKELGDEMLIEAPLTLAQRRKRALAFRRSKQKVIRGRRIAQRRMASSEKLKVRARRQAIKFIRRRVAGEKGKDYANLSPTEKMQIDKRVQQRKAIIGKIATRLMPRVRKAERERLKAFMASKNEENLNDVLDIIMEAYFKVDIEGLPPVFMTGPSGNTIKQDLRRIIKKADENVTSIERVQRADIIKAFRLQAQGKSIDNDPIGVDEAFEMMLEREDKDIGDKEGSQPAKYHSGLSKATKEKRDRQFKKAAEKDSGDSSAYPEKHAGDEGVKTKTSVHTKRYHQLFSKENAVKHDGRFRYNRNVTEEKELFAEIDNMLNDIANDLFEQMIQEKSLEGLKKKAEKSGIPYNILKKVYDRGMAAWRTGHRPGAGQEQWAYARVNSFITKGKGTWGKADADLAAQVRGESFEIEEKFSQSDVNGLEKFADRILKKYDIDVEFTRHFVDRLNDPRNNPEIKVAELQRFFKKVERNKGKEIRQNPDVEVVLKDLASDINLPVVINYKNGEFEVVNKTIMRKKDFKTPDKVIRYEAKSWRSEGHYLENGEEWDGDQHAYEGDIYTGKEHGPDSKRLYHYKELPANIRAKIDAEIDEACWDGYKQVGMKKKGKKMVPNCVPEAVSPAQQAAIAIAKKKSGKYDKDGKRLKEGAAEDRAKARIKQEKESDKIKHDRIMDRARLADTRAKNRYVPESSLNEGVNDPGIFKAVFLAGGPGSGKSFIVGKTALTSLGLKLINSDDAFEAQLKKVGLDTTPEDIYSPKGQEVRGRAVELTGLKQKLAINGRLGLVIDGTGKNFEKIQNQAQELRRIGYDIAMIFVNTDLDTAQARNAARKRTLPANEVEQMWKDVQKNIGRFQNLFGRYMYILDNSDGARWQGAVQSAYKRISAWTKEPPKNPTAKKWIAAAKAARGIKENLDEANVPKDDLNFVATGGAFGKKRRFPTFVVKKEGIKYKAYDEQDKMNLKASSNSLSGLANMLKPYIEKRIGGTWKLAEDIAIQLERDKNQYVLHMKEVGKKGAPRSVPKGRVELRGKKDYEGNGYDPKDKLHKFLDTIGKGVNMSDLMNGNVAVLSDKNPRAQKGLEAAKKLMGEETEHDKCGTPDCCGECDTATQNLDEAFTAMIGDTMFAHEFPELHAKGGFELHPSVDESVIGLMLHRDQYKKAAKVVSDLAKKNPKHSIAYWAAEVIRRNSLKLDARTLAKEASKLTEEHGAGDIGTDELVKKYKKDTPGQ